MANVTKTEHYERLKKRFRDAAKQAGYDHLVKMLWDARVKIRANRFEVSQRQKELGQLKKDYKALQSLVEEFKK